MRYARICFILTSLLLSACFFHKKPPLIVDKQTQQRALKASPVKSTQNKTVKAAPANKITRNVASFDRLGINGNINVSIHSGYSKPQVILRGDPRDLQQVAIESSGQSLQVGLARDYPRFGPVNAEIRGRYINYIGYVGEGRLSAKKLRSNELELDLENHGSTHLDGYLMLSKIRLRGHGHYRIDGVHSEQMQVNLADKARVEMSGKASLHELEVIGDGRFSFYWIKGAYLKIRAKDYAVVQLAGVVDRLDVKLLGHAIFEGRYLRADRVFVKTFDESTARISAVKRQHTLASDRSDIYFYNLSEMRTDFMAYDGSVLDMRHWNQQALKEYTPLNKWQ